MSNMTPRQILKTFLPGQQHLAEAIIARLSEAGYAIVPKEPTPEMRDPVWQQLGYDADYDEVYRAMVAAAPDA